MQQPKKARKLILGDGTMWLWRWGSPRMQIWDPGGDRHEVHLQEFAAARWSEHDYRSYGMVAPGDVRNYIENNISEKSPDFVADETAVVGKLYVYRHRHVAQGSLMSIHRISGGPTSHHQAIIELCRRLEAREPLLLVDYHANTVERSSYCKFLLGDIICTVKISQPRTWRGSFALHEEWARSAEAQEGVV